MEVKVLDLEALKRQQEKEDAGEWFAPEHGGEFLVAYAGKEDWQRKMSRLEERARARRPDLKKKDARGNYVKKLDEDEANEIAARATFGTIVLDWRKVGHPTPIEFTEENYVAVMTAKQCRGLGAAILNFAVEKENYRREDIEENAGN